MAVRHPSAISDFAELLQRTGEAASCEDAWVLDPCVVDDIIQFLTDANRSGFGRIILTVEHRKVTRANFDESVKY